MEKAGFFFVGTDESCVFRLKTAAVPMDFRQMEYYISAKSCRRPFDVG